MSPTEFEIISNKIDNGFSGVHARIDTFKDEFNNHRLACKDLFADIKADESLRKGVEKEKATALKGRINWGTVKTGLLVATMIPVVLAALKILLSSIDKIKW